MTKFIEYSKELAPTIRKVMELKDLIKDFKAEDSKALDLQDTIKEAQQDLKDYLESHEDTGPTLTEIAELTRDLKEGFAAAAKGTNYKPAEIGAYLTARAKEDGVDKVVHKGCTFQSLEELLEV